MSDNWLDRWGDKIDADWRHLQEMDKLRSMQEMMTIPPQQRLDPPAPSHMSRYEPDYGTYREPTEKEWCVGIGMALATLLMGFTAFLITIGVCN